MQVSRPNDVPIYTISSPSRSAIPDWLARQRKKALKNDPNWERRIELIQDFEFPEASVRIKSTPDARYIVATGVYKPQIRVYELAQMAMKFERHTDCETIQMNILSDDWTKIALLQADRSVEFHTQGGMHYRTRIPKFGRDMAYHFPSCDLLCAASGSEVYRLNLEQGRFMNPLQTESPGMNVCAISPAHQLWAFGGEDGHVEFFDPRTRDRLKRLNVTSLIGTSLSMPFESWSGSEVSALQFFNDGLTYAVGTSTGQVTLFDLRKTAPVIVKDHQYDLPIKTIRPLGQNRILTADPKIIKIWDDRTGDLYTSIEPETDINDVLQFPDSGLLMTANEGPRMNIFYVPSLGPAPKWCSFLDNLTEELEENPQPIAYDDYKFVTRKELKHLSLEHLIGTNLLKAYMHGFFIDLRLYEKAKAIANPFAFEDYRARKIREKMESERQSRILSKQKLPKINRTFASRLLAKKTEEAQNEENNDKAPVVNAINPLQDSRFSEMFTNPEFEIDEGNDAYQKFTKTKKAKTKQVEAENVPHYPSEEESSELEGKGSDESSDENGSDSDAADDLAQSVAKQYKSGRKNYKQHEQEKRQRQYEEKRQEQVSESKMRFFEARGTQSWDQMIKEMGTNAASSTAALKSRAFGDRLKHEKGASKNRFNSRSTSGAMSMSFKVQKGRRGQHSSNNDNVREDQANGSRERRRFSKKNLK